MFRGKIVVFSFRAVYIVMSNAVFFSLMTYTVLFTSFSFLFFLVNVFTFYLTSWNPKPNLYRCGIVHAPCNRFSTSVKWCCVIQVVFLLITGSSRPEIHTSWWFIRKDCSLSGDSFLHYIDYAVYLCLVHFFLI